MIFAASPIYLRLRHLARAVWLLRAPVRYAVVASHGVWRSLVARFVRDEEVVGSNPATPTSEQGPDQGNLVGACFVYKAGPPAHFRSSPRAVLIALYGHPPYAPSYADA